MIGGAGKTSGQVVARLKAGGLPVRSASRSSEPPFDWIDEATWTAAPRDIGSAYVTYYRDLAAPGASAALHSFTGLAVAQGVWRLVLMAGRGEEEAEVCEQIVRGSGADWTSAQSTWACQNLNESYLLGQILRGHVCPRRRSARAVRGHR